MAGIAGAPPGLLAEARAARDAEVSLMDDQLLLGASPSVISRTMDRIAALGVDRLRVSAFWSAHAPSAGEQTAPSGFDPSDHQSSGYTWTQLDRVVEAAAARGLRVMVSISTPAPLWATADPRRGNPVERPDPGQFAAFAAAVATRYRANVDHYGVLNEPNQGAWLQPQSDGAGPIAPHLYRDLVRAAYPRIKAADPTSVALVGELASGGTDRPGATAGIRPLRFLREMGCVTDRLRPIRDGRCRGFQPPPADAIGHHPYAFFSAPHVTSRHRDDAAIGDGRRLVRTIDRLVDTNAIEVPGGDPPDVFYTEFGYQTDPPDPYAGISPARQDRYLQQAAYLVWRTPRLRGINQFRLIDGALRSGADRFAEFQSGLLFRNARPKPALASFPDPIHVERRSRRSRTARVWGQIRPGDGHAVVVEHRASGRRRFRVLRRARTDARGYFSVRVLARPGTLRYRYSGGRGPGGGRSSAVRLSGR